MNRIFRIVWNRTLGRLVVTSEVARSSDKAATQQGLVGQVQTSEVAASGISVLLRPLALAVAVAAGSLTLIAPATHAYEAAGGDDCTVGADNTRVAIGESAVACADNTTAVGERAHVADDAEFGTAIGSLARVGDLHNTPGKTSEKSTAVGHEANVMAQNQRQLVNSRQLEQTTQSL